MIIQVRNQWTGGIIAATCADTPARALEHVVRRGVSLADAGLAGLDIRGAFLAGADMRGAALLASDLRGCYLRRADLRGCRATGADLSDAFLPCADLRGSCLRGADLSRSDLRGCNLVGADLRDALLVNARLAGAILDWRWSVVPLEILRRSPLAAREGWLVATLAFWDTHDLMPWGEWFRAWLDASPARLGKVADHLARFVQPGDTAPPWLASRGDCS